MSEKKKIQEREWSLLDHFAEDSNTSLSKVYDILREGRVLRNEDLMNRSWFMNFMRAVCGCVDGKMKGYRRPKISDNAAKQEVKETPVIEEKPVVSEQVIEPEVKETSVSAESMSELLKKDTILIMKWMFERKAQNFHNMTAEGFSKAKIEKAVRELTGLGILVKKNPRRFMPLDWDSLVKDFPEVSIPLTEEEKNSLLLVPKKPKEAIPEVKEVAPVRGTFAYKVLPTATLLKIIPELKAQPKLEVVNEKPVVKKQEVKDSSTKSGRDLILRSNGKDVRVVNKSNANLTVTIENGEVILTIS